MNMLKKATLATAVAASTLAATAPAEARGYYRRGGNNTAAIAVGAGVLGLALGAIVANDRRDRRGYDRRYYNRYRGDPRVGYYYRDGGGYRGGYAYDGYGRGGYGRGDYGRYDGGYGGYGDYRRGYYGNDYYRRGW